MPTNANTFNSRVTSEALEAKFREVFPSQGGAELPQDLFASGVIQPVVDFSSVAEGSVLPAYLQTALALGSQTAFSTTNTTTILANSPGFWRIFGFVSGLHDGSGTDTGSFVLTDGLSSKTIWSVANPNTGNMFSDVDFIVFLDTGEQINAVSNSTQTSLIGSYRQVADANGNLVNPAGFTFS